MSTRPRWPCLALLCVGAPALVAADTAALQAAKAALEAALAARTAEETAALAAEGKAKESAAACRRELDSLRRACDEAQKAVFLQTKAVGATVIPDKIEFGFADNSAAVERAEQRLADRKARLSELKKELSARQRERDKQATACARLSSAAEVARAQVAVGKTRRRAAARDLDQVLRQLGEATRGGGQDETDAGPSGPSLAQVGAELAAFKGEVGAAEISLAQAQKEASACKGELAALDDALAGLDRSIASAERQLAEVNRKLAISSPGSVGGRYQMMFEQRIELQKRLTNLRQSKPLKLAERAAKAELCQAKDLATQGEQSRLDAANEEKKEAEAAYLEATKAGPSQLGPSLEEARAQLTDQTQAVTTADEALKAAQSAVDACAARTRSIDASLAAKNALIDRTKPLVGKGKPAARQRARETIARAREEIAGLSRQRTDNETECGALQSQLKIAKLAAETARELVRLASLEVESAEWRTRVAEGEAEHAARDEAAAKAAVAPMGPRYDDLLRRIADLEAAIRPPRYPKTYDAARQQKTAAAAISVELEKLDRDCRKERGRLSWNLAGSGADVPPSSQAIQWLRTRLGNVQVMVDGALLRLDDRIAPSELLDLVTTGSFGITMGESRYERAKRRLGDLARAYVNADISAVMEQFANLCELDRSVLRNAVLDDFANETDIRLDLELLSYAFIYDGDDLTLSLRWNRLATQKDTGGLRTETGSSLLVFARDEDFRIRGWRQSAPFGRRDKQLRQQIQAGQVTDQTGIVGLDPFPVARTFLHNGGSPIVIDFDADAARVIPFGGPAPSGGDDISVERNGIFDFTVADAVGSEAVVVPCPTPSGGLMSFQQVDPTQLVSQVPVTAVQQAFFAGKTNQDRFFFLDVRVEPNPELVTVTWISGPFTVVNPSGTVDCP